MPFPLLHACVVGTQSPAGRPARTSQGLDVSESSAKIRSTSSQLMSSRLQAGVSFSDSSVGQRNCPADRTRSKSIYYYIAASHAGLRLLHMQYHQGNCLATECSSSTLSFSCGSFTTKIFLQCLILKTNKYCSLCFNVSIMNFNNRNKKELVYKYNKTGSQKSLDLFRNLVKNFLFPFSCTIPTSGFRESDKIAYLNIR